MIPYFVREKRYDHATKIDTIVQGDFGIICAMDIVLFFQSTTQKSWRLKLSGAYRFAREHDWFVQVVESGVKAGDVRHQPIRPQPVCKDVRVYGSRTSPRIRILPACAGLSCARGPSSTTLSRKAMSRPHERSST